MTGQPMSTIEVLRVIPVYDLHEKRDITSGCVGDTVIVSTHQAVGRALNTVALDRVTENRKECSPVPSIFKDACLSVSTRHEVVSCPWELNAPLLGHADRSFKRDSLWVSAFLRQFVV